MLATFLKHRRLGTMFVYPFPYPSFDYTLFCMHFLDGYKRSLLWHRSGPIDSTTSGWCHRCKASGRELGKFNFTLRLSEIHPKHLPGRCGHRNQEHQWPETLRLRPSARFGGNPTQDAVLLPNPRVGISGGPRCRNCHPPPDSRANKEESHQEMCRGKTCLPLIMFVSTNRKNMKWSFWFALTVFCLPHNCECLLGITSGWSISICVCLVCLSVCLFLSCLSRFVYPGQCNCSGLLRTKIVA